MMSYIVLFLLMLIFIAFLPQLIYFALIMWVVLTVARVFMPRRKPRQETRQEYQNQQEKQYDDQTNQRSTDKNVIDVEYTEREVDE